MNFLVIDGATDKICFFSHYNNNSYNKSFESSKNNYEKFSILLFDFLNQNNINLSKISHLFVNQGPGSFSGIRTRRALQTFLVTIWSPFGHPFGALCAPKWGL